MEQPNRMRQRWEWNGTIRQKIIISSILCFVIPALISLLLVRHFTKDALEEQAAAIAYDSLAVVERYVENLVSKMIYTSTTLQFDPEIYAIVSKHASDYKSGMVMAPLERVQNAKRVSQKLDAISFPNERMHISIVLPDGQFYTNYPVLEYDPKNFAKEPWFPELEEKQPYEAYWIGIHPNYLTYDKDENPYMITIIRQIRNLSSEPLAVIIISLSEQHIGQFLRAGESKQNILLIDGNGMVLSDRDGSGIGHAFPYVDLLPVQGQSKIGEIDGVTHVFVRKTLPYADWQLVSVIPYVEAVGKITALQQTAAMVLLMLFTIFLLIEITFFSKLTKPIQQLSKAVAEVEEGNLEVRSHVRGRDEVGRLGQSFDQMLDRIHEMIEQIHEEQALKRKAELDMLQAQINPHFLFNVLNSIRLRILTEGDAESAGLISSLSAMLRMTINRSNEFIALEEEMDIVLNYVKLMNFRHNEQISLVMDISHEALPILVPRFFMQPLIENAFLHGLEQNEGNITVFSRVAGDKLAIQIEDDGKGMDVETLQALMRKLNEPPAKVAGGSTKLTGIGLKNVIDRMKLIYGDAFSFDIESACGKGTRITLYIPVMQGGKFVA